MYKIVGIGANVFDELYTIDTFPQEDTKFKAESVTEAGGGPCATGLVTAAKLGASCAFLGNYTDDTAGKFLQDDFERYGVSTQYMEVKPGYHSFRSVIWLAKDTASRTCVFHRGDVPPTVLNTGQKQAIADAEILMVDGNDMLAAIEGAKLAKASGTKVLYDAGGLYEGVENLLPYSDILIPSEEFALGHTKAETPEEAARSLYETYRPEIVVITQGKKGGLLYDGVSCRSYYAFAVDAVDSNGAGDVFHGAFAYAMVMGQTYDQACRFSGAVSAIKCTKVGARYGVPNLEEVNHFLKERNVSL